MSKVFICYRRAETVYVAEHIYADLKQGLEQEFGQDAVFIDLKDVPPGVRFPSYLSEQIAQAGVMLVIIGKQWLTVKSEGSHWNPKGSRRLDDPGDFVRLEIEAALQRGITLIPVLVQGASMPEAKELPKSLRGLVEYEAHPVRQMPDFENDIKLLIAAIKARLAKQDAPTEPTSPISEPPGPPPGPVIVRQKRRLGLLVWSGLALLLIVVTVFTLIGVAALHSLGGSTGIEKGTSTPATSPVCCPSTPPATPTVARSPVIATPTSNPPASPTPSHPPTATLTPHPTTIVLNFDSVSVTPGQCVNATTYLSGYGISYAGPSYPTICNDTGMCCVNPTSKPNFFNVDFATSQTTYSLIFSSPVSNVSFCRTGIASGSTSPQWTGTAYNAQGQPVGTSIGENQQVGPQAQRFTITGSGITKLTIVSACCVATANNPPIDDLTFTR